MEIFLLVCLLTTALYVWKADVLPATKVLVILFFVLCLMFLILPQLDRALGLNLNGEGPMPDESGTRVERLQFYGFCGLALLFVYYAFYFNDRKKPGTEPPAEDGATKADADSGPAEE